MSLRFPLAPFGSLPLTHPAGFVYVARFPSAPFPPGTPVLMGKPAEKWLTEHQHQIELASADSSLVISQFNGASARLRHCRNKRYAQTAGQFY
jgi:hypothetical protein